MNTSEKFKQPESRKLEFKRKFPAKGDILKTIVAFANGAGGELIIGISDKNRDIVGIDNPLDLEEKIVNIIYDSIYPTISPFVSIIDVNGKKILNVQILPGVNTPYFIKSVGINDGVYIRIGSSNRKASTLIIEELKRRSRGLSFEEEIISSLSFDDLDKKALRFFLETPDEKEISPLSLAKWHILKQNNGNIFPTIMGILLFGKEELSAYDYMNIRLSKFNGVTLDIIEETKEFTIPILLNLESIFRDTVKMLKKESILEGLRRIERTIIPEFAIREVILNAVAHRDYSIRGATIKINVFDDRLEVISPGILFGNLDLSDLGKGISESRNRRLVRVLRKLGYVEELGTGIARILKLYNEYGLEKVQFIEQGQFFKVILPQKKIKTDLSSKIYVIILISDEIGVKDLADRLNIHKNTVLKHIATLLKTGKIFRIGKGKKTIYRIKK